MKSILPAVLFTIVPATVLLTRFTHGTYLPRLATAEPQTWTIQYVPLLAICLIAAVVGGLAWWRLKPAKTLFAAALLNAAWAAIAFYAIVELWGDKV